MIPFVFLPCGLLWLRAWFGTGALAGWKGRLIIAGAVVGSVLLNPASAIRAWWGFFAVYKLTQVGSWWGSIMYKVHAVQYLPTLVTLAPPAVKWLGVWVGGLLSVLITIGIGLAWRRARDPLGAFIAFSGGCVLLLYTMANHFVYGWQKSVQFTGIFVSAVIAGAIVDALYQLGNRRAKSRRLVLAGSAGLVAFMIFAVGLQCRDIYKWSEQKRISQDWFTLRDQSYSTLNKLPIMVEAATFRMAFYYGMWAAYFLPESHIYFAARGEQSGGYLRSNVINEASQQIPPPSAVLVSRAWADSFDANSPRILTGREYVLLRASNRVFTLRGVFPLNGPPDVASTKIELEVLPQSGSVLHIELFPRKPEEWPAGSWQIARRAESADAYDTSISGPPPWVIKVPLVPGRRNQITLSLAAETVNDGTLPFRVRKLLIEDNP
jgi:hypothetical protein